ncbi:MAG: MmgE/PrpD family protein [Chloroflexi bacterium]|nr:MmgE/PrpD family protein [Chloroflexota bacterium]
MHADEAVRDVAAFVAATTYRDLPADTIARAKAVLLDDLGAILAGSAEPEATALRERIRERGAPGQATLLGPPFAQSDVLGATLANGSAGTFLELDEGYRLASAHAGIYTAPAALATAEELDASGRRLIEALVLSYDVVARAAEATSFERALHPHGVWGSLGAAVAVAKLRGFEADRVRATMEIASSLVLATPMRHAYDGGTVRNAWAGLAGQLGVQAAQLATCGFDGLPGSLAVVVGEALLGHFDPERFAAALGERYAIRYGFHKHYASCMSAASTVDALLSARLPADPAAITRIRVAVSGRAAALSAPAPRNTLQARFSLPFTVAAAVVLGTAGPEAFTAATLRDPRILDLARRIEVTQVAGPARPFPHDRPAHVVVELADGATLELHAERPRGDFETPLTAGELEAKFRAAARRVLPEGTIEAMLAAIEQLEDLGSVRQLTSRLAVASARCASSRPEASTENSQQE